MTRAKTVISSQSKSESKAICKEVNRIVITSFVVAFAVVGLWSIACLAGGVIAAGGPIGLMKGLALALGI